MSIFTVSLLALVAVVSSEHVHIEHATNSDYSAHRYHTDIGVPLANKIRAAEALSQPTKITGGLPAVLGQFPYQAGIVIDLISGEQSVCGGAILTNLRVLTAAHCWWNRRDQAWRFTVVGGSITLFTGGLRRVTSQVIMHGDWNPDTNQNNMAMIYLATTFTLSSTLAVIPLPTGTELLENFVDLIATASGYGIRNEGDLVVNTQFLSYVNLHVISNTECLRAFPNSIQASHICTNERVGGGSLCKGDGGGPLVVISNGRRILVGIASLTAASGCQLGSTVAYSRISHYIDWIHKVL